MQHRLTALLMVGVMAFAPALHASGKKEAAASVSFHIETDANDNPKLIFPQLTNGQTRHFRRMPEITTKDIVSFRPFPSEIGGDYGVMFQLKDHSTKRLAAVTNMNSGRWLVAQLNGRIVDGVLIDKQIDDGFIVIWKGVTLPDIAILDESIPRTGGDGKKKKKK